jgi:hypothetical protein
LDASEFAIHLDQVLDGRAPLDYRDPGRLFSKTYFTSGLLELTADVVRRLSGEVVSASSVITLTTQFGGGKTHALTILYHLARLGRKAESYPGIKDILAKAKVEGIPKASVAVFVGTEFDFITGRGSKGEPIRKTPWGDIAWQLGGLDGYKIIEQHDLQRSAPGKEVIRKILPKDKPVLILMDEVLNFMSRARASQQKVGESTLASQFYEFLHNLTEEVSGRTGACLVLSLPKSEREMSVEDVVDLGRLENLGLRVGKAYVLSEGLEIAEIIRRRLFEDIGPKAEREAVAEAYAAWIVKHRDKLPTWFPVDYAKRTFEATYPFYPTSLSVFERKWQALLQFQRTRGVLRMFALWISKAYEEGFKGAQKDLLISLGSAPFEDTFFRAEVFNQLGQNLEAAVTADIAGDEAHATRLDQEATGAIKDGRLHRKVAASIFFESSGGQVREFATEPEIRLDVAGPDVDTGNIETVLESLSSECYHLTGENGRFWISSSPNLNKLLADRRANIPDAQVKERMDEEIEAVFSSGVGASRIFFPEESGQIPDAPLITLVVLRPEESWDDSCRPDTERLIDKMTKEHGASGRTYKSALIWTVADRPSEVAEEARKLLAWQALEDESQSLNLSEPQMRYLAEQLRRSKRDTKEAVWRTYRNVVILNKDNTWKRIDLGLVHSSSAESLVKLILTRLVQEGDLEEEGVSPSFLARNWPPALKEWSTKSIKDMFYASPQFPRLTNPETLKKTITEGVSKGFFGYAEKAPDGSYANLRFGELTFESDIEISDDVYLLSKDLAEPIKAGMAPPHPLEEKHEVVERKGEGSQGEPVIKTARVDKLSWEGDVPPQKWMTFYTKVLTRFPIGDGLRLRVKVEAQPQGGISKTKVDETKAALKELGCSDEVKTEGDKEE